MCVSPSKVYPPHALNLLCPRVRATVKCESTSALQQNSTVLWYKANYTTVSSSLLIWLVKFHSKSANIYHNNYSSVCHVHIKHGQWFSGIQFCLKKITHEIKKGQQGRKVTSFTGRTFNRTTWINMSSLMSYKVSVSYSGSICTSKGGANNLYCVLANKLLLTLY